MSSVCLFSTGTWPDGHESERGPTTATASISTSPPWGEKDEMGWKQNNHNCDRVLLQTTVVIDRKCCQAKQHSEMSFESWNYNQDLSPFHHAQRYKRSYKTLRKTFHCKSFLLHSLWGEQPPGRQPWLGSLCWKLEGKTFIAIIHQSKTFLKTVTQHSKDNQITLKCAIKGFKFPDYLNLCIFLWKEPFSSNLLWYMWNCQ